ncbi:MAG: helix-turn-helix domain-containing protein [Lachnospiraceae bacterium]
MYRILKGGCDTRHAGSFHMQRPDGLPNYVLLIIRSYGEFQIAGRHFSLFPGHAVILSPDTPYSYSNPKGDYMDDWLHFEVEDTTAFQALYPMINIPFPIRNTETFTAFIRQLLWEASYMEPVYAGQNIDALFTVLFNHLMTAYRDKNLCGDVFPFKEELQSLRLTLQGSPSENHSIQKCAREIGVSESYFQHLYSTLFGISFQKDLIRLRIDHAKYLLTTTDLKLVQIAALCGYSGEVHFYRQFKQITGITPARFRKQG